jgi:hypothetical protein
MSEAPAGKHGSDAVTRGHPGSAATGAADWLHLAAAPAFAIMALLTGVLGSGSQDALCSIASASPLSGMVPMYLLMSAFHLAPWLKLISNWRSGAIQANYRVRWPRWAAAAPQPEETRAATGG